MSTQQTQPWVLVTGATSGIGLATAVYLAGRGHRVIASGRSDTKLANVHDAATSAGVEVFPLILDVTDAASIHAAREQVLQMTGGHGLDVLVNNAGYGEAGALEEIPLDRLRNQFETNVIGLIAVTQAFLPEMRARKSGRIINISSVVGKLAIPLMSAYSASKHAVEALSEGLRMELRGAGIEVSIVAPGSIQSNFGSTLNATVQEWAAPSSPYHHHYQRWAHQRMLNGAGRSPLLIAEAVRDAVESARPKPRYAITIESKVMPALKALVPARVLDYVMSKALM